MSQFFYINVDGTEFQSSIDTIRSIPIFESYLNYFTESEVEHAPGYCKNNSLFLDRNYNLFQQIYVLIQYPTKHTLQGDIANEMIYYGINEDDFVNNVAEFEVTNLINNPKPFYVSACGTIFRTTKHRLRKAHYFDTMFTNFSESNTNVGIESNPLFLEIVPEFFDKLLCHLRNESQPLPSIIKMLYLENPNTKRNNVKTSIVNNVNNDNDTSFDLQSNGLIQLFAGQRRFDMLVTQDTSFTFFKRTFQKHSKFSKTFTCIPPTKSACKWGDEISFDVKKHGDLLGASYLVFELGGDDLSCHVNNFKSNIMYRIVDRVELKYCGSVIDTLSAFTMWQEELLFENEAWSEINHENGNIVMLPLRFFLIKYNRQYQ